MIVYAVRDVALVFRNLPCCFANKTGVFLFTLFFVYFSPSFYPLIRYVAIPKPMRSILVDVVVLNYTVKTEFTFL